MGDKWHYTEQVKTHLSHCLSVHEAIIHNETIKTNNTVPGHIVIKVFKTNLSGERRERNKTIIIVVIIIALR